MTKNEQFKHFFYDLTRSARSVRIDTEDVRRDIENRGLENDIDLKKSICGWVKWVVSIYLIFVAILVVLIAKKEGELSDAVMIALLTTTTINILGLPFMIIKSLFPKK